MSPAPAAWATARSSSCPPWSAGRGIAKGRPRRPLSGLHNLKFLDPRFSVAAIHHWFAQILDIWVGLTGEGEREVERAAAVFVCADPKQPVVGDDYRTADGQSHPHPIG